MANMTFPRMLELMQQNAELTLNLIAEMRHILVGGGSFTVDMRKIASRARTLGVEVVEHPEVFDGLRIDEIPPASPEMLTDERPRRGRPPGGGRRQVLPDVIPFEPFPKKNEEGSARRRERDIMIKVKRDAFKAGRLRVKTLTKSRLQKLPALRFMTSQVTIVRETLEELKAGGFIGNLGSFDHWVVTGLGRDVLESIRAELPEEPPPGFAVKRHHGGGRAKLTDEERNDPDRQIKAFRLAQEQGIGTADQRELLRSLPDPFTSADLPATIPIPHRGITVGRFVSMMLAYPHKAEDGRYVKTKLGKALADGSIRTRDEAAAEARREKTSAAQ